eukprot:417531-Prymnesium_polylepis.3
MQHVATATRTVGVVERPSPQSAMRRRWLSRALWMVLARAVCLGGTTVYRRNSARESLARSRAAHPTEQRNEVLVRRRRRCQSNG